MSQKRAESLSVFFVGTVKSWKTIKLRLHDPESEHCLFPPLPHSSQTSFVWVGTIYDKKEGKILSSFSLFRYRHQSFHLVFSAFENIFSKVCRREHLKLASEGSLVRRSPELSKNVILIESFSNKFCCFFDCWKDETLKLEVVLCAALILVLQNLQWGNGI